MIIKSLSRKSNPGQLFSYVLKYSVRKNAMENKSFAKIILQHNLYSKNLAGYIKEFKTNENFRLYRRNDSVIAYHHILSFSPKSKELLKDFMLKDIAKKFVELQAPQSLCLAVSHQEKNHTHIHLIQSGVKTTGYSSRISKQEFAYVKLQMEKYIEKYPELSDSKIEHANPEMTTPQKHINIIKNNRQSIKNNISIDLMKIFETSKSRSDFLAQVKSSYQIYNRNNIPQGIIVDGLKFRLSRLGLSEEKLSTLDKQTDLIDDSSSLDQMTQAITKKSKDRKNFSKSELELENIHAIRQRVSERELGERCNTKSLELTRDSGLIPDEANELNETTPENSDLYTKTSFEYEEVY